MGGNKHNKIEQVTENELSSLLTGLDDARLLEDEDSVEIEKVQRGQSDKSDLPRVLPLISDEPCTAISSLDAAPLADGDPKGDEVNIAQNPRGHGIPSK